MTLAAPKAALDAGAKVAPIPPPLAVLAVRLLVIGPEERYLTDRFGPAYLHYRSRTRRWIGRAVVRGAHPA